MFDYLEDIPEEYRKTVNTTLNIIDYADNTERRLREKLARKGHSQEAIDYAVNYAKERGILNDMRYLLHISERIANGKLYGRRRVIEELYGKGFKREDIESLDFEDIDFAENCARRIRSTAHRYKTQEKLIGALIRYGYDRSDIETALHLIKDEDDQAP